MSTIVTLTCPVCNAKITAAQFESNIQMLKHHEDHHQVVAQLVKDKIMEVGKLKDKISSIMEEVTRVSGYKIPH